MLLHSIQNGQLPGTVASIFVNWRQCYEWLSVLFSICMWNMLVYRPFRFRHWEGTWWYRSTVGTSLWGSQVRYPAKNSLSPFNINLNPDLALCINFAHVGDLRPCYISESIQNCELAQPVIFICHPIITMTHSTCI